MAQRGERHGQSKLTEEKVREIRKDTRPLKAVSRTYGVAVSTVSQIRNGQRWAWVE